LVKKIWNRNRTISLSINWEQPPVFENMKPNIKSITLIIVLLLSIQGIFVNSAFARRVHYVFDFSRMPENIQQLKEALLKIEEFIPRIRFEQRFLDSPEDLQFILGEMKNNGITPVFILDFYRLVEEIEAVASEKLNTTIKTDRIFLKPRGNNASANIVVNTDINEVSYYRIEPENFENKRRVFVLIFDLDNLFNAYKTTEGNYKEALKALIAHELGHNLSDVETTGDFIEQMQSGFNSRYVSVIQFDFSQHDNRLPVGFIMNRLNEIIADTIALQLAGLGAMRARDKFEGAVVGLPYYLWQSLDEAPRTYMTIYDAWRVAKARFLGLDDIADAIEKQFYIFAAVSEHREVFQQLVEDFSRCFAYWGLDIPGD